MNPTGPVGSNVRRTRAEPGSDWRSWPQVSYGLSCHGSGLCGAPRYHVPAWRRLHHHQHCIRRAVLAVKPIIPGRGTSAACRLRGLIGAHEQRRHAQPRKPTSEIICGRIIKSTPLLSLCRWHECAGYPRSQLPAAVERRAEPGPAGHPARSSDRGSLARSATLGPHSSLVQGRRAEAEADRRQSARRFATCRHSEMRVDCAAVSGFFEWKPIKAQKARPYAIATKDGGPFGLGGLWENWKDRVTKGWIRTFAVITTDANAPVADIHDRMPPILAVPAGTASPAAGPAAACVVSAMPRIAPRCPGAPRLDETPRRRQKTCGWA
jgi:hypothetical protein